MNATTTKLIVTGFAVGLYVLTHFFPDLAPLLVPIAFLMLGGMWVTVPGTMPTPAPNTTTTITHEVVDNTPVMAVDVTPAPVVAVDVTPPPMPTSEEAPPP